MNDGASLPPVRLSTGTIMLDVFKEELQRYNVDSNLFKMGIIESGMQALNHLQNMYYSLPAARHIKSNTEASKTFIDSIDNLRVAMATYAKTKTPPTGYPTKSTFLQYQDYQILDNAFDDVTRSFFIILFDMGYSP